MAMKNILLLFSFTFFVLAQANGQVVQDSLPMDTIEQDSIILAPDSFQFELKLTFFEAQASRDSNYIADGFKDIYTLECKTHYGFHVSVYTPGKYGIKIVSESEALQMRPFTIHDLVSQTAGVNQTQNGLSFKGSREDGTAYYLDGMRLINPILYVSSELLLK